MSKDPAHDSVLMEMADRKAFLVQFHDALPKEFQFNDLRWAVKYSIDRLTFEIAKRITEL